ncbi:MAG: hypothetical protein V4714_19835 [Bacteroidota bacterium]
MKKLFIVVCFCWLSNIGFAQAPVVVVPRYEYMQVTTIESLLAAGVGRSRMLVTDKTGQAQELPMANVFSLGGINFSNIKDNDKSITLKLNELTEQGWELAETTAAANNDIFITRYLLRRPK